MFLHTVVKTIFFVELYFSHFCTLKNLSGNFGHILEPQNMFLHANVKIVSFVELSFLQFCAL
jgi:hypothetical protein